MPKKHLGQHFLSDPGVLGRIVDFADPRPSDTIVEIGPGRGTLTRILADRVARVIAIEVDVDLTSRLSENMPANVEVREQDALLVDYRLLADSYAVIANLPYNISTPLLDRFVNARGHISRVTVLLQKEVADRILSPPGIRTYGPLSVGIQHYANPRSGFLVPPGAFRPPPKVYSRVLSLDWIQGVADNPDFVRFVGRCFSSRRKKLVNNLAPLLPRLGRAEFEAALVSQGLQPDVRPESLSPAQFFELWRTLRP